MRFGIILGILMMSVSASAFCPHPLGYMDKAKSAKDLFIYKNCAEGYNDDAAQAKLAKIYDKGSEYIQKNPKKALYFYQLSAENGNAESQARLAQLLIEADKSPKTREMVYDYLDSVVPMYPDDKNKYDGSLMHPYLLLLLANENPENKWYYPSAVTEVPDFGKSLYRTYGVNETQKKNLMKKASEWKKRKILDMANQLLDKKEFQEFEETLYPKKGAADEFKRSQALAQLKAKVEQQKEQERKDAATFY